MLTFWWHRNAARSCGVPLRSMQQAAARYMSLIRETRFSKT
jgi:hypothetical protein